MYNDLHICEDTPGSFREILYFVFFKDPDYERHIVRGQPDQPPEDTPQPTSQPEATPQSHIRGIHGELNWPKLRPKAKT